MMRLTAISLALLVFALPTCADDPPVVDVPHVLPAEVPFDWEQSRKFVQTYCSECHTGSGSEGDFRMDRLLAPENVRAQRDHWVKVALRVQANEMPPREAPHPATDQRTQFVKWVEEILHEAICGDGVELPPTPVRRLNRAEYSTTLQELLGIAFDAGNSLPSEGSGGEGFDNAAETLFLSPIHAEKYLAASREALNYAIRDPGARQKVLLVLPGGETSAVQAARKNLDQFLPRAYRRPVSSDELESLLPLFVAAQARGESFDESMIALLQGALLSPHFLFRLEEPNLTNTPQPAGHYEMACRLSYFLWGSMPDRTLFDLAQQGKLQDPAVLTEQTLRMLRDARAHNFAERFIEQWLRTRELGREIQPDPKLIRGYDTELEWAIKNEPVLFFRELLTQNESLLNLIDSDFTFLNEKLRNLYQLRVGTGQNLLRVKLPEGSHRGGVLTMAAVLAVTSYPHRTSPVLRGKWVLETILGAPPPPPPPNVPELPEKTDAMSPRSLRERLEIHRQDAVCASCHNSIDPLGFGLDNFDVIGRWRSEDEGLPVDASGQLPDGSRFTGPEGLKQALLARKDQFIRQLVRKTLGYALGRGLTIEDDCVVDDVTRKLQADGYRAQTLIVQIVLSDAMRTKSPTPRDPSERNLSELQDSP